MEKYFLNRNTNNPNGDHEVHVEGCYWLPLPVNRIDLGYFSNCADAVREAKRRYPSEKIDGCIHCCRPCHHG